MKTKKPNKETLEAIREAELAQKGLIDSKSYNTVEELIKDILSDEDTAN